MGAVSQDLFGSSIPAVENDELEVTLPSKPESSIPEKAIPEQKLEHLAADSPASDGPGLTLLQKVLILVVLSGCVVAFVRTRKTQAAATEKTLA